MYELDIIQTKYDAIFLQSRYFKGSYETRSNSEWGCILSFFLTNEISLQIKDFDFWLNNNQEQERYINGLEIYKRDDSIEIHGDETTLLGDREFTEYLSFTRTRLKDIITEWRAILQKYPPVIILEKSDGNPVFTPRYDIDLSSWLEKK